MIMDKQQQLEQAKKEIISIFEDYSIEVIIEDDESYFEDGLAFIANIRHKFGKTNIKMRVEMIPEKNHPLSLIPSIEFGEDNWEEIDAEKVWKRLYLELIIKLDKVEL